MPGNKVMKLLWYLLKEWAKKGNLKRTYMHCTALNSMWSAPSDGEHIASASPAFFCSNQVKDTLHLMSSLHPSWHSTCYYSLLAIQFNSDSCRQNISENCIIWNQFDVFKSALNCLVMIPKKALYTVYPSPNSGAFIIPRFHISLVFIVSSTIICCVSTSIRTNSHYSGWQTAAEDNTCFL